VRAGDPHWIRPPPLNRCPARPALRTPASAGNPATARPTPPRRAPHHNPSPQAIGPWDFLAIGLLSLASALVSYNALHDIAKAINVPGRLAYIYPLILDGFIAYSVRSMFVFKHAPRSTRFYVAFLMITSTAASLGINRLHAVMLYEAQNGGDGQLHPGKDLVGLLSMIPTLALAGAVHLALLTSKYNAEIARTGQAADTSTPSSPAVTDLPPVTAGATAPGQLEPGATWKAAAPASGQVAADAAEISTGVEAQETGEHPAAPNPPQAGGREAPEVLPTEPQPAGDAGATAGSSPAHAAVADDDAASPTAAEPAGPRVRGDLDELTSIARRATAAAGGLPSRSVAEAAIRAEGFSVSKSRLSQVMKTLADEHEASAQSIAA
jgi:putative flippase GtrA